MAMNNIYDNQKVRQFMSDVYLNNKYSGEVIDGFQKAVGEMNSNYYFTNGKENFVSFSIKHHLQGKSLTLFKKLMNEVGFECKFNVHGDCTYTYKGEM